MNDSIANFVAEAGKGGGKILHLFSILTGEMG